MARGNGPFQPSPERRAVVQAELIGDLFHLETIYRKSLPPLRASRAEPAILGRANCRLACGAPNDINGGPKRHRQQRPALVLADSLRGHVPAAKYPVEPRWPDVVSC